MSEDDQDRMAMDLFGVDSTLVITAIQVARFEAGKAKVDVQQIVMAGDEHDPELVILLKDKTWFKVKPSPDIGYVMDLLTRAARMMKAQKMEQAQEAERLAEEVLRKASGGNGG